MMKGRSPSGASRTSTLSPSCNGTSAAIEKLELVRWRQQPFPPHLFEGPPADPVDLQGSRAFSNIHSVTSLLSDRTSTVGHAKRYSFSTRRLTAATLGRDFTRAVHSRRPPPGTVAMLLSDQPRADPVHRHHGVEYRN